ncbi:MAG: DUF4292 domain-containing protein, partial [Candidatus Paceibacterota bacterium]
MGNLLDSEDLSQKKLSLLGQERPLTAKFLLNVSLRYGKDFNSFRQGLVYRSPSSFRVETYPIQAAWSSNYFISNGQEFLYFDAQNNKQERGDFQEDLFEKYYNIPVTFDEILNLLLGQTPKKWILNQDLEIYSSQEGFFCSSINKKYFWTLDQNNQIKDFSIYQEGTQKIILKGVVLSYLKKENQVLPNIIQLEIPEHDVKITIRMSQVELNQSIAS